MTKIRVYCASPAHRRKMWRNLPTSIKVVSTWHDNENFEADEQSPEACARYWEMDCKQIRQADVLLAYAEDGDRPNGTLIEIGYAIANEMPVYLVGTFEWGTWRHLPNVKEYRLMPDAIKAMIE